MPILIDIRENQVLGPVYEQGWQEGVQRGVEQGIQQGVQQGELTVIRRMIEKRFNFRSIPAWAEERLSRLTVPELEELSVRLLDVKTIEELLP